MVRAKDPASAESPLPRALGSVCDSKGAEDAGNHKCRHRYHQIVFEAFKHSE